MLSIWKHPKSNTPWFRMTIPERYRERLGKREFKFSLGTSDEREAKRRHAEEYAKVIRLFEQLDAEGEIELEQQAATMVDEWLVSMERRNGGRDSLIATLLALLALDEQRWTAPVIYGDRDDEWSYDPSHDIPPHPPEIGPFPLLADDEARQRAARRFTVLDHHPLTQGMAGQETAARVLAARSWKAVEFKVQAIARHVGQIAPAGTRLFDLLAEAYLRRLVEHRFANRPEGIEAEFSGHLAPAPLQVESQPPLSAVTSTTTQTSPRRAPANFTNRRASGLPTLSQLFDLWVEQTEPEAKLEDEWRKDVRRFIELHGDLPIDQITRAMVLDFRNLLLALPSRPKRDIARLPLVEQVQCATQDGLPTLAPATVKKSVGAIRVVLGHAKSELLLIEMNPAQEVQVDLGDFDDDRLPFDESEVALILANADRTSKCASTFWITLMAPLTGCRIEEMGKLRPHNVRCERGIWYIAIERDRRAKRTEIDQAGGKQKRAKTANSLRDIPVHWLLIEAGFLDFVEAQRAAGAEWLFNELGADKYGQRTKNLSRRIIRQIRSLGITDKEKVFHSFRHSMRRVCRDVDIDEQIADLLAGHAPASIGRKYGRGAGLPKLQEAVNRIDYPCVDWDPILEAGRRRAGRQQT